MHLPPLLYYIIILWQVKTWNLSIKPTYIFSHKSIFPYLQTKKVDEQSINVEFSESLQKKLSVIENMAIKEETRIKFSRDDDDVEEQLKEVITNLFLVLII